MNWKIYSMVMAFAVAALAGVFAHQRGEVRDLQRMYREYQEDMQALSQKRHRDPSRMIAKEVAKAAIEELETAAEERDITVESDRVQETAADPEDTNEVDIVQVMEARFEAKQGGEQLRIMDDAWRARYTELMQDPKRKAMMEAAWTMQMDKTYAGLLRWFDLTPDQLAYFKSLLVEKKSLNEDFGTQKVVPGSTLAMRLDIENKRQAAEGEVHAWILEFLGSDGFSNYQAYEASQPEREMIGTYAQSLENLGIGLRADAEDALIRAMYEERQNSNRLRDLFANSDVMTDFTENNLRELVREFDDWTKRVMIRAMPALGMEQQELLEKHLALQRDIFLVKLTASQLL